MFCLSELLGQDRVVIGYYGLSLFGTTFGSETCEELWTPDSPHIEQYLNGVEIIGNGSASHHQLR